MYDLNRLWERLTSWCSSTFGLENLTNEAERSARLLEETIELVQACGLQKEMCQRILDRTYSRPVGAKRQESAGVVLCLLAWLSSQSEYDHHFYKWHPNRLDMLFDDVNAELSRLEATDPNHFRAKHQAKFEAGTGMKPIL